MVNWGKPTGSLARVQDIPDELGDESKRKLKSYIRRHRDEHGNWNRDSNKVSAELCSLMHDMHSEGLTAKEIKEPLPISSPNTIYYHLRNDCTHEKRVQLTYDECGWMRVHAHEGAPSTTLAMLYGVNQRVASRHITGKCSHEDGIEPVSPEQLRANGHNLSKTVTSTCPECGEDFKHKDYRERRFCSSQCNAVYAGRKGAQAVNSD